MLEVVGRAANEGEPFVWRVRCWMTAPRARRSTRCASGAFSTDPRSLGQFESIVQRRLQAILTSVSRCLRVDSSQSDDGAWNIRVLSIRWSKRSIHLAGNGRLSETVGHQEQASASIEQRLSSQLNVPSSNGSGKSSFNQIRSVCDLPILEFYL